MLLKGTHTPFLGAIWLWEHWEALALKREEEERAAMGLDLDVTDNNTASTSSTNQPKPIKSKTNTTSSSKKHSLTKTGKVKIPAALLASASKRPSKKTGVSPDTNGRVNVPLTNGSAPAPPPPPAPAPAPAPGPEPTAGQAAPAGGSADIVEMMRMLKELSVQVEEVRAALVKHDQGPEIQ